MGIAYSKRTIVTASVNATSSAAFRGDVENALFKASWIKVRTVLNGAVYQCETPDTRKLQARLLVQDQGTSGLAGPYVVFQGMSADESAKGQTHTVVYGNGIVPKYQILVGKCQFFLSIPGTSSPAFLGDQSSQFAFGIPFLNPAQPSGSSCAVVGSPDVVLDIWWANGDGNLAFFQCPNFRTTPRCFSCFDFSFNRAVFSSTPSGGVGGDPSQGELTLFYLAPTFNTDILTSINLLVEKHKTRAPINLDALVGWRWIIQGQLWDAFQRSHPEPLDAIQTYFDTDAIGNNFKISCQVWMSSFYSSLLLLNGNPASGSTLNVAY